MKIVTVLSQGLATYRVRPSSDITLPFGPVSENVRSVVWYVGEEGSVSMIDSRSGFSWLTKASLPSGEIVTLWADVSPVRVSTTVLDAVSITDTALPPLAGT